MRLRDDWKALDPAHSQVATFRAIENGFSLVRQASQGLSIATDYEGRVLAASDYFTTDQQTMVAYVPAHGVRTIYATIGDLFAWLCLIGLVALTGLAIMRSRKYPSEATVAPPPEIQPTLSAPAHGAPSGSARGYSCRRTCRSAGLPGQVFEQRPSLWGVPKRTKGAGAGENITSGQWRS